MSPDSLHPWPEHPLFQLKPCGRLIKKDTTCICSWISFFKMKKRLFSSKKRKQKKEQLYDTSKFTHANNNINNHAYKQTSCVLYVCYPRGHRRFFNYTFSWMVLLVSTSKSATLSPGVRLLFSLARAMFHSGHYITVIAPKHTPTDIIDIDKV